MNMRSDLIQHFARTLNVCCDSRFHDPQSDDQIAHEREEPTSAESGHEPPRCANSGSGQRYTVTEKVVGQQVERETSLRIHHQRHNGEQHDRQRTGGANGQAKRTSVEGCQLQ